MTETIDRHCAYGGTKCRAPRVYRVTEKAVGARPERLGFCCAKHYPGNKVYPAPTATIETRAYRIELL